MRKFLDVLIDLASLEHLWINQRLIYNIDGDVIGRLELEYDDEHQVFLRLIAIYQEYRNRGYFDTLLHLITRAADKNGDTLRLIPLPTESSEIPPSDIPLGKLKAIYKEHGFTTEIEEVNISIYTRTPIREITENEE